MALEDILKKIQEDTQNKKEAILKEALEQKKLILKEGEKKAEEFFSQIISQAEKEARSLAEKEIVLKKIQIQKELLSFRREILEELFNKIKDKLSSLKVKKILVFPQKEEEQELKLEEFLNIVKSKLELEVAKILWSE